MVRGVFVTGTDTGVGKTVVACALARWCRAQGIDVGVMKPIATGGRRMREQGRARWVSEDAIALAIAAQARDPWSLINPICYRDPMAPHAAARRARKPIRLEAAVRAFHRLADRHAFVIVEGIGGVLVPLTPTATVLDLIRRLRLPVILVTRPGLGTLNHTLLTLQALRQERLRCAGLIVNHATPPPATRLARRIIESNIHALRHFVPVLGELPYQNRRHQNRRH